MKVGHPCLSKASISGKYKADLIKKHIFEKFGIEGELLMETLGRNNILLQCIDSEDNEIIIPYRLLNG